MKTLVLSLLRLGDFFQQLPLLEQLRDEEREVHVLVNDSLKQAADLFPEYRFHFFPRVSLQASLTDPHTSTLAAVCELDQFLEHLNRENFATVLNWTHNFLSARLMDLIEAKDQQGARFSDGKLERETRLSYLNETWGPTVSASFHWIDALALSMNRHFPVVPKADSHRTGSVLLQVLTSDRKKNWPIEHWKKLADHLAQEGEDVRVLCAPFEKADLLAAGFQEDRLYACHLQELARELSQAKLLVSGDTSVLHLAAWLRTPVLGIFLGSANPRKTAPRLKGARILWADTGCSPCLHRDPCQKDRHVCGDKISFEILQQEVNHMIRNDPQVLSGSTVRVFEGAQSPAGAFLLRDARDEALTVWSQIVWEFYLNRDFDSPVAPFGSAARVILQNGGWGKSMRSMIIVLKQRLELSFNLLEEFSEALWKAMRDFNTDASLSQASEIRLRELSLKLNDIWRDTDFTSRLMESNLSSDANPFVRLRNRKDALQETHHLFTVQKNLVRVLEQEFKEREMNYGARA